MHKEKILNKKSETEWNRKYVGRPGGWRHDQDSISL